jgi:hypothetical protein
MARTRVFVSSTYYDLKHVRSSLDQFIESLGYDSILSEKGDIPYTSESPLDESCYREVATADIFVLIIGGRYGSPASSDRRPSAEVIKRYDSVTKKEYEAAVERNIPLYIFIESGVHAEYQTFTKNKNRSDIEYAHVDSTNIFHLIEAVLAQPRNNPVRSFDRFSDIEQWLREQWSGLFRELLRQRTQAQELASLNAQVSHLQSIGDTLKTYLEQVLKSTAPKEESEKVIAEEHKKLSDEKLRQAILSQREVIYFCQIHMIEPKRFADAVATANTVNEFVAIITEPLTVPATRNVVIDAMATSAVIGFVNGIRRAVGLPPIPLEGIGRRSTSQPVLPAGR